MQQRSGHLDPADPFDAVVIQRFGDLSVLLWRKQNKSGFPTIAVVHDNVDDEISDDWPQVSMSVITMGAPRGTPNIVAIRQTDADEVRNIARAVRLFKQKRQHRTAERSLEVLFQAAEQMLGGLSAVDISRAQETVKEGMVAAVLSAVLDNKGYVRTPIAPRYFRPITPPAIGVDPTDITDEHISNLVHEFVDRLRNKVTGCPIEPECRPVLVKSLEDGLRRYVEAASYVPDTPAL